MKSLTFYMTAAKRREILTTEGKVLDLARIDAAEAKRARKAAKRLREMPPR